MTLPRAAAVVVSTLVALAAAAGYGCAKGDRT